ncbi:MAG TPA: hypothetical protein DCY20_06380 [Firmicutes bacterium]|nr:hypothetical protein [Bacillota bacterium]
MQQLELMKWRTGVVKNSTSTATKAEFIVTLTVPKSELTLAKSLFRSSIQLKRTSYFDRYFNHPVKYFDYTHGVFYTPSDIVKKNIDIRKLDYIYAELKQAHYQKKNNRLNVLPLHRNSQNSIQLSTYDRNQTLQYPTLFKSYLESLYYTGQLEITYDAVNERFMTLDLMLYDINYLTSLITEPLVKDFIQWINKKYKTEFNLDDLSFQIKPRVFK